MIMIPESSNSNQVSRVYDSAGISPTVSTPGGGHHLPKVLVRHRSDEKYGDAKAVPPLRGSDKAEVRIVASRGRNPANSSDRTTGSPTEQRLEPNKLGISNTLSGVQKDNLVQDGLSIRRLTPRECERLQGFPDDFTRWGLNAKGEKVEISDTQRYKMLGNAVSVPIVRMVGQKLMAEVMRRRSKDG